MTQHERTRDRRLTTRSNIVLVAVNFYPDLEADNFSAAVEQTLQRAGISWEQINVAHLAMPPTSFLVSLFHHSQPNCEMTTIIGDPIKAIVYTQRALQAEDRYAFGLSLYAQPKDQKFAVSAVVLKRTSYLDDTKRLPEDIVCSICDASDPDIASALIGKANEELERRQKAPIAFADEFVVASAEHIDKLSAFFDKLGRENRFAILIWCDEHQRSASAILIQT